MSKRKKQLWQIIISDVKVTVEARTPGAVFRQAIRRLIRTGKLKNQPQWDYDAEPEWYKGCTLPELVRS